jgi:hypothetical protein
MDLKAKTKALKRLEHTEKAIEDVLKVTPTAEHLRWILGQRAGAGDDTPELFIEQAHKALDAIRYLQRRLKQ